MEKALYILAELSDRDFEWLLKNGELERLPAGTTLIQEGGALGSIYLVLEGALSVTVKALKDREIARLAAGEVVGEMSFVDERAPSATVSALTDVQVWKIPRTKLVLKLSQDTAFAAHFYQAIAIWLSHRLRGTISRWGYAYGYGKDPEMDDLLGSVSSAQAPDSIEIARIRLDWMLSRMKG